MCADMGVGLIPYSPLARGLLAGARLRSGGTSTRRSAVASNDRPEDFEVQDTVLDLARRLEVPMARVALAWLLGQAAVCAPIVGATKPDHIQDAIAALDLSLSDEDVLSLESGYVPRLVSNFA
jgi:1-deoxyxylulose-5-phosphate synthase